MRTLRVVARAAKDEVDHGGIVHRRVGVGPGDERRHAARRGRGAEAGDRLAMLGARLADEGAHVDEARRDDVAGAVDDQRVPSGIWSRVTAGPTPAMTPSRTSRPPRTSVSRAGSTRRALRRATGGAAWAALSERAPRLQAIDRRITAARASPFVPTAAGPLRSGSDDVSIAETIRRDMMTSNLDTLAASPYKI